MQDFCTVLYVTFFSDAFSLYIIFFPQLFFNSEASSDLKASWSEERWGAELQVCAAGTVGYHRDNGLQCCQQLPFQVGPYLVWFCKAEMDTRRSEFCICYCNHCLLRVQVVFMPYVTAVPGVRLFSSCCRQSPLASSFSIMEKEPAQVRLHANWTITRTASVVVEFCEACSRLKHVCM